MTRLTTLGTAYPEVVEQQQAQRLLWINLIWLLLTILAMPLLMWWALDNTLDAFTLFVPVSFTITLITHHFLQTGQLNRARWLFVLNILVASLLTTFPDYRLDSPFIIVLTLPLTAAGVLLQRSEQFAVILLLVIIVVVGGLMQINVDMEPTPFGDITESIRSTLITFVVVIGLNATMLWLFLTSTEEALRQQRELVDILAVTEAISQTLAGLPAPGDALNQAIEELRTALDLYHVQVFLTNPTSGLAVLKASTGYIGRRLLEEDSLSTPDEDSPVNDALRSREPLVILDSDSDMRRSGFLPATQSQVLVPLRVKDYFPFGVLDLHSTEKSAFSSELMHVVTIIGNHLAAALYSIQQVDELRASFTERDKLIDQIEANRRELAKMNRQIVGTTWGTYLAEREDTVPGFDLRDGTVIIAQSESEILNQTLVDGQARLDRTHTMDTLSVPIRLRGQILGALEFRRPNDEQQWSGAVLDLVQAISDRLALSLENARLFEQAQSTAQREQMVNQITSELQSNNELHALLMEAAVQFQEALGATHTRVRLGLPDDIKFSNDRA
ncbi:MAG: GAF domain-containing protein [Anaerolineae bacterium]|nr:GAF domain-containing protein [Anaerolineae bacterium]